MKSSSIVFASALFLTASGAFAQGAGPTDAQIAHIVVTANQVDIDAGKLAQSKGRNKDVKAFGKQMVTDHTGVNKQATALVRTTIRRARASSPAARKTSSTLRL